MPIRQLLATLPPTLVGATKPFASKSVRPRTASRIAARVTPFGPSFATMLLTAVAKISPATHACAPNASGFLSYCRKLSSSGLLPLSSNGRNDSHT